MQPVIAIVGRPNVGKSTLFNCLTKSRDALVANRPGLTRDRQYGHIHQNEKSCILIDTGGISGEEEGIDSMMLGQSYLAMKEADVVLFLVDAQDGVTASDEVLANEIRKLGKTVLLVVNKVDGYDERTVTSEFHSLGLGEPVGIAASHNRGVRNLQNYIFDEILADFDFHDEESEADKGIKIAVVGRPNVGKSTLVNRLLGEERVVVYDLPGTTRDSIYIPYEKNGKPYTLIDTAGVRRRGKVKDVVEKFSIVKTIQAIEDANVVIVLLDASEAIVEQDLSLIGMVLEAGRSMVLAINKWDGLDEEAKEGIKKELDRRFTFLSFVKKIFISAKHGTGVGNLYPLIDEAYASATKSVSTNKLTTILENAVMAHQPPAVHGRRIKLRYAHAGGSNPPIVVIHGNQTEQLPDSYVRYLENTFRKALKLVGTPIRILLKSSDNPFEGRKNALTERQLKKRQRMIKHIKKKK